MKRILTFLLGLFAAQCEASMIPLLSGSPPSPILFQDAMNYADNTEAGAAGWSFTGANAVFGITSGPGSLSGVNALRVVAGSTGTTSPTFTGHTGGTIYIYVKSWACTAAGADADYLTLRNGATGLVKVVPRSALTLRVTDIQGGTGFTTGGSYVIDTVYYMKVEYTPGTGSNDGVVRVFITTDSATWGSAVVNRTTSTATSTVNNVRFSSTTGATHFSKGLYVSLIDVLPNQLP